MLKKFRVTYLLVAFFMALSLLAGCGGGGGGGGAAAPTFETLQGDVRCVDEGDYIACRGIPYAAPPVDNLRFAPPEDPADRGDALYNATEFGSVCPQKASAFGTASTDEDCLFLNIYMPEGDGPYPVMVWIHGGAMIYGSGNNPPYDPARIVEEGVILVTINYRLGALGFLPHAALTADAGQSGNYGLMDQQQALRWIQANIANFNGDPGNVTIFGESAGGHSVLSQLVAAGRTGLFHQAIVESGSYAPVQIPLATGEALFGGTFALFAGCSGTDAEIRTCLRNLSVADILDSDEDMFDATGTTYIPVYGGAFLPISIYAGLASGAFERVPIIIGSNKHEGQLFVLLDMLDGELYANETAYNNGVASFLASNPPLDEVQIATDYLALALAVTGGDTSPFYPNRYRVAMSLLWSDYFFSCPNAGQWQQLSPRVNTYAYWFTDEQAPHSFGTDADLAFLPTGIGATHTLEIQYVFGTIAAVIAQIVGYDPDLAADQIALSNEMVGYWTRFAKTGDPNGGGAVTWSPYSTGTFIMEFDDDTGPQGTNLGVFGNYHNCLYWANPPTEVSDPS